MPQRHPDEGTGGGSAEPAPDLPPDSADEARHLTDRQLEILVHVARGRTNREIGGVLGISERTVRNHMRTINKKLSTGDRTRAVVLAIEHGWIPIPILPDTPRVEAGRSDTLARPTESTG
ncbi:MAG: response regulator transcription factor [Chloroflexota bacterium]